MLWGVMDCGPRRGRKPQSQGLHLLCLWFPRVHGSYENLWAGQVADALVDLTGSLAERWSLKDIVGASGQQDRPSGGEQRTCRQLLRLKDQCVISCSVLSPRAGTVCCYSPSTVSLLQKRKPVPEGAVLGLCGSVIPPPDRGDLF